MSEQTNTEYELPENIADAPELDPPRAQETAPKPKKVIGRPFTKENARDFQMSATAAKRRRREARLKMLNALTGELDLGQELLKAMRTNDEKYLGMIMTATKLVGLQYDQAEEVRAQQLNIKSDNTNKTTGTLEVVVKGLENQ